MATRRRKVFLTGATGNWGREALREFVARSDRFEVVALVLPTESGHPVVAEFGGRATFVFGDLTDYEPVERCVRDADYVVHVGAVVSPFADDHPGLTRAVNVGGARNILRAVSARPDPDAVGVVMIGSIAETGDRNPPHHWGRIGDPVKASEFDVYAQSKIEAERALVDSGLRRWAWLRQTGIFHPGLLGIRDPIMTHTPLAGVMEWASVGDSARLLVNACEDGVPEQFWGGVYNIGGGEEWRLTNWEFQVRLLGALGVRDVRRFFARDWFATRNFHGQWYTDSDRLEELVPFRSDTFGEALARAAAEAPGSLRLAGRVPAWLVKRFVMAPLVRRPRGTMSWIETDDEAHIRAFFGSREEWAVIGDWSTFSPPRPSKTPSFLDHGYDEAKDPASWTLDDLAAAADFRGGALVSAALPPEPYTTPLDWKCADGHAFRGSPRLILTAGHWCPVCVAEPADYPRQAEANKFLAQVV
ncbi:NAD(P)H-binding protein [Amycolatopsis cynarae]|uniref:NAD(P)H-binding protein n=1 Tax=Amycolatopsis cynarae TaxID=2995223 RepID=A0ABY7BBL2_9PSEU|nr:NAD(P)H-binding protein [Amycolatopsis sp. HUAS 11-8]WAL69365.1 NAD(P)H-binding protein [Amycolatopsis sp. HUAS 11-8]